jgi:hypothetical protein
VDLSLHTSLRSIRIDHLISSEDYQFSSPVPDILLILSEINSPCLEEMEFSVTLSSVKDLDAPDFMIDWDYFDALLMQIIGVEGRLKTVRFWVKCTWDLKNDDVEMAISERLKRCAERGMLCFAQEQQY